MFQPLFLSIRRALRQNIVPGIILQAFALLIALSYFYIPATHIMFDTLAQLKQQAGWRYSAISTAIFGGLIPYLYLVVSGRLRKMYFKVFLFYIVLWAEKGVEVDLFYQLQSYIFGDGSDVQTVVKKVLFDQLIYSALWAAPGLAALYLWKDSGFKWSEFKVALNKEFLYIKIPTIVASNWLVWFPAVAVIYSMPPLLQIPLFNLVLCFFVLLITSLSAKE